RQDQLHPENVDRGIGDFTRREWNDAAVNEVAHDPVARRPVTAVTENVVTAEIAAVADALPATGTEAHGKNTTSLRCGPMDKGRRATTARCSASQYRRMTDLAGSVQEAPLAGQRTDLLSAPPALRTSTSMNRADWSTPLRSGSNRLAA